MSHTQAILPRNLSQRVIENAQVTNLYKVSRVSRVLIGLLLVSLALIGLHTARVPRKKGDFKRPLASGLFSCGLWLGPEAQKPLGCLDGGYLSSSQGYKIEVEERLGYPNLVVPHAAGLWTWRAVVRG